MLFLYTSKLSPELTCASVPGSDLQPLCIHLYIPVYYMIVGMVHTLQQLMYYDCHIVMLSDTYITNAVADYGHAEVSCSS